MVNKDEKIDDLFRRTTDPFIHGQLLVMKEMVTELSANTVATTRIADGITAVHKDLDAHVRDEEKMLAAIRGGQWVGGILMTALLGLGGYIIKSHMDKNDGQDIVIAELRERVQDIRTYQLEVQRRLGVLEDEMLLMRKGK